MSGSKRKGSAGERELLEILLAAGIRAYRNDQIFKSGEGNPDIAAELAGKQLHIEVKRVERLNILEAVKQALKDAEEGHIPIVAHRRNREQWLITVPLAVLLDLLREVQSDG